VWNFRTDEDLQKSPGYRRLIADGIRVESLIGDMRTVLELLGYTESPTKISDATFGIDSMLTTIFSRHEIILWCANVLNSMGHGRLSLHALEQLVKKQEADFDILKAYAESEHHRGKYRDAERSYMQAAKLAPDEVSRRIAILDASDEARCFGHWRRAVRMIEAAVSNASGSMSPSELVRLRARELLKRTLIQGHWLQVTSKFHFRKIAASKRAEAAAWIREGSRLAIENGLWFDFQQFRLWAERMDLSANVVLSSGPFEPPASREGYTQLGYSLALLMVTRDHAKTEKRSGGVTLQTISELEKALSIAEELGCYPEMWKMTRLFITLNPIRNFGRTLKLIRYFSRCQHAPTKRLPFLLLGA
jgi:tetratricopeptide (TPR) repeat protein